MQPYLTAEIPGIGGTIKETVEDFAVTEIPLYLPCGEGEHVYTLVEKRGITTLEALRRLSRAMEVPERDIGYAGMKDARGVTRQTFSIPRVEPDRLLSLELPGMTVISAVRHRNKLKLGHLAGNRFRIRVRGVEASAVTRAQNVLAILVARGVPNCFGMQRYGVQGNSHLVGRAMVRRDSRGAVEAIIGEPAAVSDGRWREAIEAYRRGDLAESIRLFPGACRTERDLVQRLQKQPEAWDKALHAVHPRLKKLYLSAYQSFLFDRLLAGRLDTFDQVLAGDLAYKHDNGASFLVEDPEAEASRAARFEISPSGPLFGCRVMLPGGEPLQEEEQLLREEGIQLADFDLPAGLRMEGERRPLRVPLGEPQLEGDEEGLVFTFSLPKGAYATSVLREIMKTG